MRFLLYSYNFSPEKTGIGKYNGELAVWLARRGHKVDVITTNPYYPEWRVHPDYQGQRWRTERDGNLTVYRCPMYVPKNITGKTRILSDLSFIFFSAFLWVRLFFRPRYDVVMAVCPSLFIGWYPYLYSCLRRTRFVYHFQDLQLDAAIQLGLLKNTFLIALLKKAERFLLRKAYRVASISEGMKEQLFYKGVAEERYLMLENWVDTSFIKPLARHETEMLRREWGLEAEDRVILYSGNMGEKQGLEVVLEAAARLQMHSNWKFILCGEGVAKRALLEATQKEGLTNVYFKTLLPYERLAELLALGDVHLVPQKRAAADLVLPSKLTGILAAGGLAIVAAEEGTTLYRTIHDHALALVVEPENGEALSNAIKTALSETQETRKRNALTYAQKKLDKNEILENFEKSLLATLT
ncbi:colanic acid biosynthesis fucosyltransferase WcaI [Rhabdobacter roseus]|uniref:Colanic acid biosynthesis glycosyl transferase WcaI n=1 Tax=Rhabdobacter roseus TaxID=1655419 RepID=A0A840TLE9_9BACT|nr:colanic acid biosynthesis glycosyl transferase WcaI [Rhabdobacter roseus]